MQNNRYNAVIFDLDGVVIDTKVPIEEFWIKWGTRKRILIDEHTLHKKIHGRPAKHTLKTIFSHLNEREKQEIMLDGEQMERALVYTLMPGVMEFIQTLADHQIKTALVTSSLPEKVETVFRQLELSGFFHEVITADQVNHGKPAPDCYLLAAKKLGIPPQSALVFEDSASGVLAAHNAGMHVVGINEPIAAPMLVKAGAMWVVPDFTKLKIHKKDSPSSTLFFENSYDYSLITHVG